jgi:pimeloyl-ACP methyl ester carboxylesterase
MVEVSSEVALFTASTEGPAEKTLLVIHGGPDWDHSYLRAPLWQLAGSHRVVLPDLRGCGRSTSGLPDERYTPDAVVGDLLALMDELGTRQVAVLGFSYGGLIAQRLAVTASERIGRLVIASSSVLPVDVRAFGEWPEREERLAAEASTWADPSLSGPGLTRAVAIAGAPANVWRAAALPGYLDRLAAVRFSAEWMRPWRAGTLASPRLADPIGQLGATGIPVLLLHGRQDMMFPASTAERAAALLPCAQAVVLDHTGHMAHVDQPQAWLAAIADFLD